MFDSILIVCIANTCRSPIADILLQHALPHKNISSAGIRAVADTQMSKKSTTLTSALGLDCSLHRSRQLTAKMCRENDLILVMENSHIDAVIAIEPSVKGKIFLVGKWLNDAEISDPYEQDFEIYKRVFNLIKRATDGWIAKLN